MTSLAATKGNNYKVSTHKKRLVWPCKVSLVSSAIGQQFMRVVFQRVLRNSSHNNNLLLIYSANSNQMSLEWRSLWAVIVKFDSFKDAKNIKQNILQYSIVLPQKYLLVENELFLPPADTVIQDVGVHP